MVAKKPDWIPGLVEWVPLAAIRTDQRVNTRPVDNGWVDKKLSEGFDPSRIGLPIVSYRSDESYVVLDGQNRCELMRRAGFTDRKVQCRVFFGLTLAEEANLFLGHNDNRQVKPVHKFIARVTAGEPDAVAITKIVKAAGWKISDQIGDGKIMAVRALERVYLSDRNEDGSPGPALDLTLRTAAAAWGLHSEGVSSHIIVGLGALFRRFGDQIDRPVLVKKLAEIPSGASGLYGKARGLQQLRGGTVAESVAEVVVSVYNAKRRKNLLPDWRS